MREIHCLIKVLNIFSLYYCLVPNGMANIALFLSEEICLEGSNAVNN